MTLSEAMARNDIPGEAPSGVALRLAPRWMRASWAGPVAAMTTPAAVWVSPAAMARIEEGEARHLLRHELAHVEQWRRLGRFRFLRRYLADYLLVRAGGFSHATAYAAIGLERDAEAAARGS